MLILASASPRRHELLTSAGIHHTVRPAEILEHRRPDEPALLFVRRMAEEKAAAALQAAPADLDDIILAADTIVSIDNEILGKPADAADAARMLALLSGRTHAVHTGICLLAPHAAITDAATTEVTFLPLSQAEIQAYIGSGEPFGKAGAYAIQGRASRFVSGIRGCYSNVVGLPVSLVYRHLQSIPSHAGF